MLAKISGSVWVVLEYGWYPLLAFITTPYFLHVLGAEKYGHWMLLTAIASFGAFLNVGTGAATIKYVSSYRGRQSKDDVGTVIRASIALAFVGGALLAAVILGSFWFGGDTLFGKMGDQSLVRLTGTVAAVLSWIEQIDNVFASTLKGAELFGRAARIEMACKTVQIIGAVVSVTLWGTLATLYVTLVLTAVARLLVKAWIAKRSLAIRTLRPTFSKVADIFHFAKWGWIQGLGGLLFGIADRALVGSLLGAADLAHYSVALQLAQQIHALPAAGLSVLFPSVSRNLQGNPNFSLWKTTKLAITGNLLFSSALTIALLMFGKQILSLWLGTGEAEASSDVLWYLAIASWFLAINVVPHFILLGTGRARFVAISNLAAGVLSLSAMVVLGRSHGLIGIGLARIVYGVVILVNFLSLIELIRRRRGELPKRVDTDSSAQDI